MRDPSGLAQKGALWGAALITCTGVIQGGGELSVAMIPGLLPWCGAGLVAGALYGALTGWIGVCKPHRPSAGLINFLALIGGGGLGFGAAYLYAQVGEWASASEIMMGFILCPVVGAATAMIPALRYAGLAPPSQYISHNY